MDSGQPLGAWGSRNCEVHKTHQPVAHGTHIHHVQPLALGGPDIASNRVEVCPTGHMNIHMLLDLFIDYDGNPPKEKMRGYARREVQLANAGFTQWVKAGRPRGKS